MSKRARAALAALREWRTRTWNRRRSRRCRKEERKESSSVLQKPRPVFTSSSPLSSPLLPPQHPPSRSGASGSRAVRSARGRASSRQQSGWEERERGCEPAGGKAPSEGARAEEEKIKLHLGGKFYQGIVIVSWQLLSIWVISWRDWLNRRNVFPSEMIFSNSLIEPDPVVLRRASKRLIRPTWPAMMTALIGALKNNPRVSFVMGFFNDSARFVAMRKHAFIQLYVIKLNHYEEWWWRWWSLRWLMMIQNSTSREKHLFQSQAVETTAGWQLILKSIIVIL